MAKTFAKAAPTAFGNPSGYRPLERLQRMSTLRNDPYQQTHKLRDGTLCEYCGACFAQGRWQWVTAETLSADKLSAQKLSADSTTGKKRAAAARTQCPACRRIREHLPAGVVCIAGPFAAQHRGEVQALIRHQEQRERAQHPLQRVMDVTERDDALLVTTTDIHLARAIGDALHAAYRGTLSYHYNDGEYRLDVLWTR